MPWSYPDNVPASMKYFKPSVQKKAIAISNHILANGGDEGIAIATGIKKAKSVHDKKASLVKLAAPGAGFQKLVNLGLGKKTLAKYKGSSWLQNPILPKAVKLPVKEIPKVISKQKYDQALSKIAFIVPGAILGAAGGAYIGGSIGKNEKKRTRNARIGALTGGIAGAVGGAYGKHKFVDYLKKQNYQRYQPSPPKAKATDIGTFFKEHGHDHTKFKSKSQAKKAYRDTARRYHPDLNPGIDPKKIQKLNDDWEGIENSGWFHKLAALHNNVITKNILNAIKNGDDKYINEKYKEIKEYVVGKKSLVKVATNRMTKELMEGRLSDDAIDKIRFNKDTLAKPYHQMINQRTNLKFRKMLRPPEQTVAGIHRGTEALAKKHGILSFDVNNYSNASMEIRNNIDAVKRSKPGLSEPWMYSHATPTLNIDMISQNQKVKHTIPAYIVYDKKGKSLTSAIGGRHELFEQTEGTRIGKKVNVTGFDFNPKVSETSVGNANGTIGNEIGKHSTLGVLGKESTETSRLFFKDKLKIFKARGESGESNLLEGITGRKFGTKYHPKDLKLLDKIKYTPGAKSIDIGSAINQGKALRKAIADAAIKSTKFIAKRKLI